MGIEGRRGIGEKWKGGNRGECGRGVPPRPPAWPCCDTASRPSPVSFSYIVHFYFWSSVVLVRSLKFLFQGALTDIFPWRYYGNNFRGKFNCRRRY